MALQFIRFFNEIGIDDIPLVGGKNASLGEMYQNLAPQGVKVPYGFAISAEAYRFLLDQSNSWEPLKQALADLNPMDAGQLIYAGQQARDIIYQAGLPDVLQTEIIAAYQQLKAHYQTTELSLAVRSSATAEDLPTASFAGQQDTYLNITDEESLLETCKRCFASLFTDRAIHYRIDQGFDHFNIALSIGVMKMVRSDLASSGVMFSLDTESGFKDVVFITASYGLGENIVQGAVEPDEFYVHKPTFLKGYGSVLRRAMGAKKIKMVYADPNSRKTTQNIETSDNERQRYCISDEDVLTLADYAIKVEQFYSDYAGHHRPMDMEWAKDALDGELYLVQARPETVSSQKQGHVLEEYKLQQPGEVIASGYSVGEKIAAGQAHIINDVEKLVDFKAGEVLVAHTTTPDWEPIMKMAAAIVTDHGGRTCHAAIIARELGIPAVIGCENATQTIPQDTMVTVSCAEGDSGHIYQHQLPFEIMRTNLSDFQRPKTKIMLNLGNPDLAFKTSFLPNDGVGLARMEFIINEYIKIHPMALLFPERINNDDRGKIQQLISAYSNPGDYFIEKLSEGVGTIAAAFYPKPVVVRMSDFKTNEYASLLGGGAFESAEANPMIGFRGASRYTHPAYEPGFALECAAMKRVREIMGLDNVILMIPFCRRIDEARKVLDKMTEFGLKRGENGLKIYVMCEIPNNVLLIDAFAELFDGFSIGSNDLTQLTLGVDRDSDLVAFDFDERDPGVKQIIKLAVEGAKRNQRHSGICGQAPSDYPEMAEYLVKLGIDSISLNPDTVIKTSLRILEVEKRMNMIKR